MRGVDDPRLAVYATRSLPVWLWSTDGSRVRWANPVAAKLFQAANVAELAARIFGPADPRRRQIAQLAGRLPPNGAVRLERLRGFGASLGAMSTCACSRLEFPDGTAGVLIAAAEAIGRPMPLIDRLRGLVEGADTPIAVFASDGLFVGSSDAARTLLGFRNLTEAGLDQARAEALQFGRSETPIGVGHVVLQRVGSGADVGLIALLRPGPAAPPEQASAPSPTEAVQDVPPQPEQPAAASATASLDTAPAIEPQPDAALAGYESFETTGEAPAEFALLGDDATDVSAEAQAAPSAAEPGATAGDDVAAQPAAAFNASAPSDDATTPPSGDESSTGPVEPAEPSPFAALSADEPSASDLDGAAEAPAAATHSESADGRPQPEQDERPLEPRRHPLRFVWQIDADARFAILSDEFVRLIGPDTAMHLGAPWQEIAERLGLDPEGRIAAAIATRHTWSGIAAQWPVDGVAARLPVEMSGLPVQNRDGVFSGYRGFGVCRDLAALDQLAQLRQRAGAMPPQPLSADRAPNPDAPPASDPVADDVPPPATEAIEPDQQPTLDTPLDTPKNVLPFRPANEARAPALTPVENSAFHELARQLSARLESEAATTDADTPSRGEEIPAPAAEPPVAPPAEWLTPPATPAKGTSARDRMLLDLLPLGVLIYRLDRLLYANAAFLQRMGFASLAALEDAGGLDALFVEPGVAGASSAGETGTPITIAAAQGAAQTTPSAGRLFTIEWDGEQALALIFSADAATAGEAAAPPVAADDDAPSDVGQADAEELGAILDTTAEGVLMFDAAGDISAANRSAEALFGYDGSELVQHNLLDLFAPESRPAVLAYLDSINSGSVAGLLDHGLEALGRVREGGLFPLTMTMGRTRADGPNFFAVFRDLSQLQRTESELIQAKRNAERAAAAKADVLARLSHEIRAPLNAIIGFAEVMIEERFGPLGNERYVEYMKDIRASGERVIGIVSDLLDLSRIETGKLDLSFASQGLNETVEQCVAEMQPRANRERIIIRTSLAHPSPTVVADAHALRQIIVNLIGTSIHLANAGGQVIVSTALSDAGEVVLRVRDTGHRLNDDELAAALQPFHAPAPGDRAESAGIGLSLTKALVEANRAAFHVKSAPQSGTLIEVVFNPAPTASA